MSRAIVILPTTSKSQNPHTSTMSSAFIRFLNSETGPKTVHFWAPVLKWSLVIAGISDISRPVEKVSGTQNLSLLATGVIWTRWSFVIKPKNYLLASVNFFLAGTAGYQISRLINYRSKEGDSPSQIVDYLLNGPKDKQNKDGTPGAPVNNEKIDEKAITKA